MLTSHIRVPTGIPPAQVPIQPTGNVHGKATEHSLSTWFPATCVEDPDEILACDVHLTQTLLLNLFGKSISTWEINQTSRLPSAPHHLSSFQLTNKQKNKQINNQINK